jgi:hypothetical protein
MTARAMARHRREVHADSVEKRVCPICQKCTIRQADMVRHLKGKHRKCHAEAARLAEEAEMLVEPRKIVKSKIKSKTSTPSTKIAEADRSAAEDWHNELPATPQDPRRGKKLKKLKEMFSLCITIQFYS